MYLQAPSSTNPHQKREKRTARSQPETKGSVRASICVLERPNRHPSRTTHLPHTKTHSRHPSRMGMVRSARNIKQLDHVIPRPLRRFCSMPSETGQSQTANSIVQSRPFISFLTDIGGSRQRNKNSQAQKAGFLTYERRSHLISTRKSQSLRESRSKEDAQHFSIVKCINP